MNQRHRAGTATFMSMVLMLSMIACASGSAREAIGGALDRLGRERAESSPGSSCSHPGCADEGSEAPASGDCCLTWAPPLTPVTLAPPALVADPLSSTLIAAGSGNVVAAKSARPAWNFPPGELHPLQLFLASSLPGRAPPLA